MIGGALEAQVTVTAADPVYSVLARHRDQLRYLFIVSAVKLEQAASGNGSSGVYGAGGTSAEARNASAAGITRLM